MTSLPGQSNAYTYPNTSAGLLPNYSPRSCPENPTQVHKLVGPGQSWLTEKEKTELVAKV